MAGSRKDQDEFTDEEAARRRDEALKRGLGLPPRKHEAKRGEGGGAKRRPHKAKRGGTR